MQINVIADEEEEPSGSRREHGDENGVQLKIGETNSSVKVMESKSLRNSGKCKFEWYSSAREDDRIEFGL